MYGSCSGRRPCAAARTRLRACAAAVAVAALLLLPGCSASSGGHGDRSRDDRSHGDRSRDDGGGGGPRHSAAATPYWVDPDGNAARQAAVWRSSGRAHDAALLERIARQPVAEWVGTDDPEGHTRRVTEAAEKADREALLVFYDIPHRDCGQYSQGGAADGAAYRAWLAKAARGIGDRRATVVLEPDALPHLEDGCTPRAFHEERYALIARAVRKLTALPHTTVYLDAGNPHWIRDPRRMAEPLRRAGIGAADGFALNISNYRTTAENTAYGKRLSALVGGKPFVIDTSRNGNGPAPGDDPEAWCNPPGRALGKPPTTDTGEALVDAYLWIKRPGESDGTCKGGPPAGEWWPERALALARNARG